FDQSVLSSDGNVSEAAKTNAIATIATVNAITEHNDDIVTTTNSLPSSSTTTVTTDHLNHSQQQQQNIKDQSFHQHQHHHRNYRRNQQQQQQQEDYSSLVSTINTTTTNKCTNNDKDDDQNNVENDSAINVIASSSSSSTTKIVKNIQQQQQKPPPSITTSTTSSFSSSSSSSSTTKNLFVVENNNQSQQQQQQQLITTLPSSTLSFFQNNNNTNLIQNKDSTDSLFLSSSSSSKPRSILYEHLLKELSPTSTTTTLNQSNSNSNNNETFEFFLPNTATTTTLDTNIFLNNKLNYCLKNDQYLSDVDGDKQKKSRKNLSKKTTTKGKIQRKQQQRNSMKNRMNRTTNNDDDGSVVNNNRNNKRKSKRQELQQQEDSILQSLPIHVVAALLLNQQQQNSANLTAINFDPTTTTTNIGNINDRNSLNIGTTTTTTTKTLKTKQIVNDNINELINNNIDNNNCNSNNIMNLSTKQAPMPIALTTTTTTKNNEDDSSIPLNLCVKKSSSSSSSASQSSSTSLSSNNFGSNNNKFNVHHQQQQQLSDSHTLNLVKNLAQLQQQQNSQLQQLQFNNSLISQQQQQQPQHQQQQQQKKRGRKPKSTSSSLMAYGDPQPHLTQQSSSSLQQQQQQSSSLPSLPDFAGFGNLLAAFNHQQQVHLQQQQLQQQQQQQLQQPRKRGRPPTLSPPHNAHQNSLTNSKLAVSAINQQQQQQQATSAFHQNTYPFNLFNTPAVAASANDGILPNFPGLNALSFAAAAAIAAGGANNNQLANHQLFNNAVNQFNILQKLNPNLLNANLFGNLKNPIELAAAAASLTANNNDNINNKHTSSSTTSSSSSSSSKFIDPALFSAHKELTDQVQANFLASLPAAVAKNFIGDQSSGGSLMNKNSFAHHKSSSTNSTSDKQIRIPLNHGFQRFTYITGFSKTGTIEGDVIYLAPCKKKLKSYQDLIKYLSKNNMINLNRENFSFDPNIIIGQFIPNIAQLPSDVILSENQMKVHLEELSKIRNLDLSSTSITAVPPSSHHQQSNQINSNHHHQNIAPEKKKRVRDSGGTRNVYDSIKGFNTRSKTSSVHQQQQNDLHNKNHEFEPSVTITIQNPQQITPPAASIRGTKRKSTERHEQARNEKLLKKQQEELERKQRELKEKEEEELRKIKEHQEKLLELQKQEQLKISAEIEHERVNQHQMFIHALNELKSSEDRDSKKEELSLEKVALQERKLLKRVLEVELLKELKKPVEDMMLKDHKNLPIFNRIPGQKLTGKAFADLLMVYEFLYNFGETIGFDIDSLPTLNSLMMALLNLDSESEEELMSIVNHLVICAIEDPGMPNNMTTLMGQKLKDATVTEHNVTEILRLYFFAFSNAVREEDEPNRIECQLHEKLCNGITYIALDAITKLDILVFLCNELLCNQAIVKQIDDSIESVTVYKKDKWGIENDIRKLRLVKMRRERIMEEEKAKQILLQQEKDNANTNQSSTTTTTTMTGENGGENMATATNTGDKDTTTGENNSTVISDNDESNTNVSAATLSNSVTATTTTTINLPPIEFDDDVNMTNEEIDKKIERLNKQCNQMNNKMHKALNAYRVFPLGQDRYRRTYWVLPNCGGVFVEGMESGEPEELPNNIWTEEEIEMENALKNAINDEPMDQDLTIITTNGDDGEINKSELTEQQQSVNNDNDNVDKQTDEKTTKIKEENDDPDISTKNNDDDNEKKPIVDGDEQVNNDEKSMEIETKMETNDSIKIESNDDGMDKTNQTMVEKKEEQQSESEQIDENNQSTVAAAVEQCEQINVDDVRWFDLDLDFECDESIEKVVNNVDEPMVPIEEEKEKEKDEEILEEEKTETDTEPDNNDQQQDKEEKEKKEEDLEKGENEDCEEEAIVTEIQEEPMSEMEKALTTFLSKETLDCLFKGNETNIDCTILKDCLIRILSSFARSASITKFPNSDVIETDIIVCPTLQKRIQLWKILQYEKANKIPREYQFGWWRITDSVQLKSMIELLHTNGQREKNLQKYLIKHLNYATQSCRNSTANLDVGDYDRDASDWREFGAPTENRCPHRSCLGKDYCHEVAFRKDLQVLELIEAFEEKILSCSMQMRNWKPTNKFSSSDFKSKLNQTKSSSKSSKNGKNRKNQRGSTMIIFSTDDNGDYDLLRVQKEKLLEIEATIERRYLETTISNGDCDYNEFANDDNATAGLIRWRDAAREAKCCSQIAMGLHFLENCIAWDKSIMRASCQFCGSGENEAQLLLCDLCDKGYHMYCFKPKMETVPTGDWFCYDCQNKNTIDKVCIVCGKKGKLLNCDTCAKVFHPNCLDPPVNKQIKGRWICHLCMRKNKRNSNTKSSSSSSKKSSSKSESTANNDDKNYDSNNKDSNQRESNNKRMSNGNSSKDRSEKDTSSHKKERKPKKKQDKDKDKDKDEDHSEKEKLEKSEKISNKKSLEKESNVNNNDNNGNSMMAMDEQNFWPFLEPVNTKHFPTYRKIIKKPMDFTVIKNKLQNNSYKTKEDYAADIRLMFDNCVTFNEDESPVGQAGHLLRAFFESRWKELFNTNPI
ncbi:hypothetical protein DERP_009434, partial [Dermatophagoides pteronyssinus]